MLAGQELAEAISDSSDLASLVNQTDQAPSASDGIPSAQLAEVEILRDLAALSRRPPAWPDWQAKLHGKPASPSEWSDEVWPEQHPAAASASSTAPNALRKPKGEKRKQVTSAAGRANEARESETDASAAKEAKAAKIKELREEIQALKMKRRQRQPAQSQQRSGQAQLLEAAPATEPAMAAKEAPALKTEGYEAPDESGKAVTSAPVAASAAKRRAHAGDDASQPEKGKAPNSRSVPRRSSRRALLAMDQQPPAVSLPDSHRLPNYRRNTDACSASVDSYSAQMQRSPSTLFRKSAAASNAFAPPPTQPDYSANRAGFRKGLPAVHGRKSCRLTASEGKVPSLLASSLLAALQPPHRQQILSSAGVGSSANAVQHSLYPEPGRDASAAAASSTARLHGGGSLGASAAAVSAMGDSAETAASGFVLVEAPATAAGVATRSAGLGTPSSEESSTHGSRVRGGTRGGDGGVRSESCHWEQGPGILHRVGAVAWAFTAGILFALVHPADETASW